MHSKILLAILITATLLQQASAASRTATLTGASLGIDTPCARHVGIEPDPALHGAVAVSATADNQQELDALVLDSEKGARIHTVPSGCWRPSLFGSFDPTLDIVVRVPEGLPLAIDESGAGRYDIGSVGGSAAIDLSGAATISAAEVTDLTIDLSGDGQVDVASAHGKAKIDISGHGKIGIGEAAMPAMTLSVSGAGSIAVKSGHVGTLAIDDSGFSNIHLGADVTDANIDISGAGTVHLTHVTGKLEKDISGAGTVTVGE